MGAAWWVSIRNGDGAPDSLNPYRVLGFGLREPTPPPPRRSRYPRDCGFKSTVWISNPETVKRLAPACAKGSRVYDFRSVFRIWGLGFRVQGVSGLGLKILKP